MLIEYLFETLKANNINNRIFTEFITDLERDFNNFQIEDAVKKFICLLLKIKNPVMQKVG